MRYWCWIPCTLTTKISRSFFSLHNITRCLVNNNKPPTQSWIYTKHTQLSCRCRCCCCCSSSCIYNNKKYGQLFSLMSERYSGAITEQYRDRRNNNERPRSRVERDRKKEEEALLSLPPPSVLQVGIIFISRKVNAPGAIYTVFLFNFLGCCCCCSCCCCCRCWKGSSVHGDSSADRSTLFV